MNAHELMGADDWAMGGTDDPAAYKAMGFSEREVAEAAVCAYQAVTHPDLLKLGRERLLRGFFDAFRAGVLSYLDDLDD